MKSPTLRFHRLGGLRQNVMTSIVFISKFMKISCVLNIYCCIFLTDLWNRPLVLDSKISGSVALEHGGTTCDRGLVCRNSLQSTWQTNNKHCEWKYLA